MDKKHTLRILMVLFVCICNYTLYSSHCKNNVIKTKEEVLNKIDFIIFEEDFLNNKFYYLDTCIKPNNLANHFIHRSYQTWIKDYGSSFGNQDSLSSDSIDDALLKDYEHTFRFMKEIGLNEIVIWGLFTTEAWPLDVNQTMDQFRKDQVLQIIHLAHQYGLRLLSGIGVYSLGYDKIIRANPGLGCKTNTSVICPNHPDVWNWQKKILDYIFSFPIDGISMQSAGLGRCKDCKELNSLSDVAYHAITINRVAEYIKKYYPEKIVSINVSGMNLSDPKDLPSIVKMTQHADFLIDQNNSAISTSPTHICKIVNAISPCIFGYSGTPSMQVPKSFTSDRWFLPMLKRRAELNRILFNNGARAVENIMHSINNPGDEVSLHLIAAIEKNPGLSWEFALKEIINELYQPKDSFTLQYLSDLFVKAEDIYFEQIQQENSINFIQHSDFNMPGLPIYIKDKMKSKNMTEYKMNLCILRKVFNSLKSKINNPHKIDLILKCIDAVVDDINLLSDETTTCTFTPAKQQLRNEEEHTLRIAISYLPKKGDVKVLIWNSQSSHSANLRLWNYQGKLINSNNVSLLKGNNEFSISDTILASGFYYLQIIDPVFKKEESVKIVVE